MDSKAITKKIALIVGTRPEAVKMRPVAQALKTPPSVFQCAIINTGQHLDLLKNFGLERLPADRHVTLKFRRQKNSPLSQAAFNEVQQLSRIISADQPDLLLVQGDTTSAFAAALAAYYAGVPVAHIEAGLRTGDPWNPFPEEANRHFITTVARLHFAPTLLAKENLIQEGVQRSSIFVTGNTGIDALLEVLSKNGLDPADPALIERRQAEKTVLLTTHRRENLAALPAIFSAIARIAAEFRDHRFVFPVHPNPQILDLAKKFFRGVGNVLLRKPANYADFIKALAAAKMVMTDSGGVQEEAAHLGVPALVLREKTERPEGLPAGLAQLVGSDPEKIFAGAARLLADGAHWAETARPRMFYGDGLAAGRITQELRNYFGFQDEPASFFVPLHTIRPPGICASSIKPNFLDPAEALRRAEKWLLYSGIQDLSDNQKTRGGVYAWYNEEERSYPFVYSEITGYFLSTCCYLYSRAKQPLYLERARLAADWLLRNALDRKSSLMLTRYYTSEELAGFSAAYSFRSGTVYSFDNGMILNGLVNLHRASRNNQYLYAAQDIAEALIDRLQMNDGLFHATFSLKSGETQDDLRLWSKHPGSHHAKLAIGLLELFRHTGQEHYYQSARRACNAALNYQHDNGRFEIFRRERDTYTHYHNYSIEGLLYAGLFSPAPDPNESLAWLKGARAGFDWLLKTVYLAHSGGLARSYINKSPIPYESADIIAQAVRLGALFKSLDAVSEAQEQKLRFMVNRLLSFQSRGDEPGAGGFYYGHGEAGEFLCHVNAWATMFAIQALDLYDRTFNRGEKVAMEYFRENRTDSIP